MNFLGQVDALPWVSGIVTLTQMGGAVALVWYYNAIRDPKLQANFDAERKAWRDHAAEREKKIEELLAKTIECITLNNVSLQRSIELLEDIRTRVSK